ncbi:TWiK family of potassium channels protein 12-like isoform X1 [Homalodisca vitripennis]|uniref:TWiK family of potassium channels protein 12-like isoform X1 n=1 Tax=Homalodisca vitripennis TaxID=197043 RepID=UPI001EEB28AD|nr:TWiK family of potassium channels protein 12-like isoform X1 [Homalodisca vitripennis]
MVQISGWSCAVMRLAFVFSLFKVVYCQCVLSCALSYYYKSVVNIVYLSFRHNKVWYKYQVKNNITFIRKNVTEDLWVMTRDSLVLRQDNWTGTVINRLRAFESELVVAMRLKGWDGSEDLNSLQWTFHGALFYSIIVITTIGYGHIAPKTDLGKVTTIFYAIMGIPLMLLCLSNIGDIMANSFRFLYWRICCYACTQPPKRSHPSHRRGRSFRSTIRADIREIAHFFSTQTRSPRLSAFS